MRRGVHGPLARSDNTPTPVLNYRPPPDRGLPVLHVDDHILVLSKPAGLLSVPGNKPHLADCMEHRARKHYPNATTIHRLDRATSGVFVMALTPQAHARIGLQFEKRRTTKTYIALVADHVINETGEIRLALRTDWYNRPKQMVDTCLGREAITRWRVLEHFDNHTRMQLNPVTGRSHQLRVHMKELGHPILGDEFYAPPDIVSRVKRLMLHAEQLEIYHPFNGKRVLFHDPCPF